MHEYSLVQSLLERVDAEARNQTAAAVTRLHVAIGEAAGVEVDLFEKAFEVFRDRTVCSDAELVVRRVPVRWRCPRCERAFEAGAVLRCEACEVPAELAQGDEIVLDRIEMEVP
jgi:hydrogenase nickel incorporation protein HypA/HybF